MGTIGMMDDGDPRPFQSDCQDSSARRLERISPETLLFRTYKGSPLNAKDLCNPDLAPAWETAAPDTGAVAIVTLARPLVSRTMNCSASIVRGFVLTAAIDPSAASRISATTPRRK
jgi:hypothetical protein